jgi:hypothetical protein
LTELPRQIVKKIAVILPAVDASGNRLPEGFRTAQACLQWHFQGFKVVEDLRK